MLSREWSAWGKRVGAAEEVPGATIDGVTKGKPAAEKKETPDP